MIKSMTAFGRARSTVNGKDISIEIRSVNNRFFDCSTKIPRSFSYLEEKIKPYLQSKSISRGKVDVFISIDVINSPLPDITIDEGYAQAYIQSLNMLAEKYSLKNDISVMQIAQNRDIFVIRKPDEDVESDWADVKTVLDTAIERFIEGRINEGNNIEIDIKEKISNTYFSSRRIRRINNFCHQTAFRRNGCAKILRSCFRSYGDFRYRCNTCKCFTTET